MLLQLPRGEHCCKLHFLLLFKAVYFVWESYGHSRLYICGLSVVSAETSKMGGGDVFWKDVDRLYGQQCSLEPDPSLLTLEGALNLDM